MDIDLYLSDLESRSGEFKDIIQDSSLWEKLPLINIIPNHELHDHQFVRFRGMIQHMYNPEFYVSQYEVVHQNTDVTEKRSGRYRDVINCEPDEKLVDSSKNVIEERQVLYCITIPAQNDWVLQQEKRLGNSGTKSQRAEPAIPCTTSASKRPAEVSELMEVDCPALIDTSSPGGSGVPAGQGPKRLSTDSLKINSETNCPAAHLNLNFPIDGSAGMACIVKTYELDNIPPLKINDIVDVVGFLSLDPSLSQASSALATDAQNLAENPPPSIVPRLHALALQKITHINVLPTDLGDIYKTADSVRKELHVVLSQMLLGDTLAADYLICHLISLVYMRKDGLALGHFSLNLSNLPQRPDYTRLLYSVLERILPKSHYLPMTLENMNSLSFIPKMDYEANRLSSGLLQLSDNTHLVVDETRLEAGKLDAMGVGNVQALRSLISHQVVNYDFQYYSKAYDADVPVLILSEGKSLLPSDAFVPLKVDPSCLDTLAEIFQAANHFLREPLLTAIRNYLCTMRHSSYEFPEDLQRKAQDDFVEMRQNGRETVSADDLHLLLVLARLVSLSKGEKIVSLEAWEQAKRMEEGRKSRLLDGRGRSVRPSNEP